MNPAQQALLTKALCEACLQNTQDDCIICHGARYYLWDSSTLLCYRATGEPIVVEDEGELKNVIKSVRGKPEDSLSLETLLGFIELWTSEDPRREFTMWVDNGWNGRVVTGYRKEEKVHHATVNGCVKQIYEKILKLNRSFRR